MVKRTANTTKLPAYHSFVNGHIGQQQTTNDNKQFMAKKRRLHRMLQMPDNVGGLNFD